MVLDPKKCPKGEEQWEEFLSGLISNHKEQILVQYDYRNSKGELFSYIAASLEEARRMRNEWAKKHGL